MTRQPKYYKHEEVRAGDWIKSQEGAQAIKRSIDQAKKTTERLSKERELNHKMLQEPYTV